MTVSAVRQGTVEELGASGLQFDDDERNLVPYYVDATYENTGDAAVERAMRVGIEDADDNLINATVVLDFARGRVAPAARARTSGMASWRRAIPSRTARCSSRTRG